MPEIDRKMCPKCSEEMRQLEIILALPKYIEHDDTPKDGSNINLKGAFGLEVYWCPACRFVELYAA